ncbi:type I restriction-modification system subunit M [Mycoplasma sp. CB776]
MAKKEFEKTITKQELANRIWQSANGLRGNLEAYEYKDFILSFIFYSFLSQKQIDLMQEKFEFSIEEIQEMVSNYTEIYTDNEDKITEIKEKINLIKEDLGYFIFYNDLYQVWTTNKYGKQSDFSISKLSEAIQRFNKNIIDDQKYKNLFEDIIMISVEQLNKLGSNVQEQTETAKKIMEQIKDIPVTNQNYDVLGYVYEFLIGQFASTAGKKGGEFYTPHEVSVLMSEIIAWNFRDRDKIKVYDPTSGSGSLLLNIGSTFKKYDKNKDSVTYYAQEKVRTTFNLTRMNLIMKNINSADINVRCGDTLNEDWPVSENNGDIISVDAVVSNPPYSLKWNPEGRQTDPRYADYGVAPKSKADYAFLLHELYHLDTNGMMAIVLPHGVLFRGSSEKEIRTKLIKNQKIETIIGLPANIFFGTSISTIVMILKKNKADSNIQFIDASKLFVKDGKNNKLEKSHIKRIIDVYKSKAEIAKFSRNVTLKEIEKNDFNLNISRYIDNFEKEETHDLYASMYGGVPKVELDELKAYWNTFNSLFDTITTKVNDSYFKLIDKESIQDKVKENSDVKAYSNHYLQIISDFSKEISNLTSSLDNIFKLDDKYLDNIIDKYIFEDLEDVPLLDKYELFQIMLDYAHKHIQPTISVIQKFEGEEFSTILEQTTTISKTKDGKVNKIESELFDIDTIGKFKLTSLINSINEKQEQITDLDSQMNSIVESINDEDKDEELFKDGVIKAAEVKKYIKKIDSNEQWEEESLECKLLEFDNLNNQKSDLNKDLKNLKTELNQNIEIYLSNITEEEFFNLLHKEWISNFESIIFEKQDAIINYLISKLEYLYDKYFDTLSDINNQIKEQESNLINLLSELKGEPSDMEAIEELIKILGNK